MYLSKLHVSLINHRALGVVGDPHRLHQAIMAAFPADLGGDVRVLFRVEPEQQEGIGTIIVQSTIEPSWSSPRFQEQLPLTHAEFKDVSIELDDDQLLRFRLRANPTIKREGRRIPIVGDEHLEGWLDRKIKTAGGVLLGSRIMDEGQLRSRKKSKQGTSMVMTFRSVRYEGLLRVVDAGKLQETLTRGVGSAKAYGFGLLSVAPTSG